MTVLRETKDLVIDVVHPPNIVVQVFLTVSSIRLLSDADTLAGKYAVIEADNNIVVTIRGDKATFKDTGVCAGGCEVRVSEAEKAANRRRLKAGENVVLHSTESGAVSAGVSDVDEISDHVGAFLENMRRSRKQRRKLNRRAAFLNTGSSFQMRSSSNRGGNV